MEAKATLQSIVKQRDKLLRMCRSKKNEQQMRTAIALANDLLAKMPSDARVVEWIRRHKTTVLDMLPSTDKTRRQYISQL